MQIFFFAFLIFVEVFGNNCNLQKQTPNVCPLSPNAILSIHLQFYSTKSKCHELVFQFSWKMYHENIALESVGWVCSVCKRTRQCVEKCSE